MQQSKRLIYIGILSGVILLGILALQFVWFFKATQITQENYQKRMDIALNAIEKHLSDSSSVSDSLKKQIFNLFIVFDLDTPVYTQFVLKNGQIKKPEYAKMYKKCSISLTNEHFSHVNLYFQAKNKIVQLNLNQWLFFSSIFILIVAASVAAFFFLYIKQGKLNEMKTDFLNMLTHEFKTPIATMSLISEVLEHGNGKNTPEKIKRYAGILQAEISRLKMVVDKTLQVAAFDNKINSIEYSETQLNRLLSDSVEYIFAEYEKFNPEIKFDVQVEDDFILADEAHLRNVFLNILDNACKYSPENISIKIKTWAENNELQIQISDEGIGIEKKYFSAIFEKFYRIHTGDRQDVQGSGLGLYYAKQMIEAHGGIIVVNSQKDKGSKFIIHLPRNPKNKDSITPKLKAIFF